VDLSLEELLTAAGAAKLRVKVDGDRLIIRGPKSADAIARQLLDRKAEIMAELAGGATIAPPLPAPSRLFSASMAAPPTPSAAPSPSAAPAPDCPAPNVVLSTDPVPVGAERPAVPPTSPTSQLHAPSGVVVQNVDPTPTAIAAVKAAPATQTPPEPTVQSTSLPDDPMPPPGAKIYCSDERGRACGPADAFMWTFEKAKGATQWYSVQEHPVPNGHPIDGTRW
jgi:hypothetical protein